MTIREELVEALERGRRYLTAPDTPAHSRCALEVSLEHIGYLLALLDQAGPADPT